MQQILLDWAEIMTHVFYPSDGSMSKQITFTYLSIFNNVSCFLNLKKKVLLQPTHSKALPPQFHESEDPQKESHFNLWRPLLI